LLFHLPQCECNTKIVQKIASVTGLVKTKGRMKPGIAAAETRRSAFHIPLWSWPAALGLAADVVSWRLRMEAGTRVEEKKEEEEDGTRSLLGNTRPFLLAEAPATVALVTDNCRQRTC
jgi:hypothetical protein